MTFVVELISLGDNYVVAGSATGSAGRQTGIWVSSDGVDWRESLVFARRRPEDPYVVLGDVATTDSGGLVVLAERLVERGSTNHELIAFGSDDGGISWSETTIRAWERPEPRALEPVGVFAEGDTTVAFTVEANWLEAYDTVVWTFDDSEGWSWVEPVDSGLDHASVQAMTATNDGYLAVGFTIEGSCSTQTAWRSVNATAWSKVWQDDAPCRWYEMKQLFELGGELFVIGNDPDVTECDLAAGDCPFEGELHLWVVVGDTLTEVDLAPAEVTELFLSDLTVTDGALVAVGVIVGDVMDLGDDQVRIFTSLDARTWYPVEIPASELTEATVSQVWADSDRIVALGADYTPFGYTNAHAWIRMLAERPGQQP